MRDKLRRSMVALLAALAPSVASAAAGDHVLRSYWDDQHTTIYSDVLSVADDGLVALRTVVGGTVDGIGMVQIPLYASGRAPYVPTLGDNGAKLHWLNGCIFVTPDSAGVSDLPFPSVLAALDGALQEWNSKTASCSYMKLMLQPAEALEVGLDGKNTLKFREDKWCRPKTSNKPAECYDPQASAITTASYINDPRRPDFGAILDADIEVNAVDYSIAVGCETRCVTSSTTATPISDLQNTLTHEYGHVLGLDHTCWEGDPAEAPLDNNGRPAPQCFPESALPRAVVEATMYNFQDPREVSKRTVEADDVAGVCAAYPLAQDPKICEPVDISSHGGCCAVAGGTGAPSRGRTALLVAAAGALWLASRALRRRIPRSRPASRT